MLNHIITIITLIVLLFISSALSRNATKVCLLFAVATPYSSSSSFLLLHDHHDALLKLLQSLWFDRFRKLSSLYFSLLNLTEYFTQRKVGF